MSTQDRQFGRFIRVTLFSESGEGLEISDPASITFDVNLDRVAQPNEATISMYNLNQQMRGRIRSSEFNLIRLEAGHDKVNNVAVIFEGNIRKAFAKEVRENAVVSTVIAAEGELTWRRVTIEHTFPAGTTPIEMVRFCLDKMPDATEGDLSGIDGKAAVRSPYTIAGSLREFFHDLASTYNARWSIQRKSLDFVSNETAPNSFKVYRKTKETGLLDADLDESAVLALCLLDPAIKPNAVVEVESDNPGVTGFWRVNTVKHFGGTANIDNAFYSEFSGERISSDRIVRQEERIEFGA